MVQSENGDQSEQTMSAANDRAEIDEMLNEAQQAGDFEQDTRSRSEHSQGNAIRRFADWCVTHKKRSMLLAVGLIAVMLAAIPFTRYKVAGLVVKHGVTIRVVDAQSGQPVSGADVSLGGSTVKTNGSGVARFERVRSSVTQATVSKKYYQDSHAKTTVGFKESAQPQVVQLAATGRQIPIRITNKVTGAGVSGVAIVAAGTETQTDSSGQTSIVVDVAVTTVEAELKADGYNTGRVNLSVSQDIAANTFALTPAGKIYFLSKKSGTIDVAKTDLDGSNRETVLAGTGNEQETDTVMLASRDWKFLALLARRDGDHPVLYLIDTSSDKLTQIDSNNAAFNLTGWSGHNFVYTTRSNTVLDWQSGQTQLKTFKADTGQLIKIDETTASGTGYVDYAAETIGNAYLVDDSVVYTKAWLGNLEQITGKRSGLYAAKSNANDKKLVKDFDQSYLTIVQSEPHELYLQQTASRDGKTTYYAYVNGVLKPDDQITSQSFNQFYATYLVSPSSNKTSWYEPRDGKNILFIGDQNGKNPNEILSGDYVTYGWFTDDYVLVSKNGSELYVVSGFSRADAIDETTLQKVTDYHKPSVSFVGYGGGYGGL